jgi:hypothetical protein
VAGLLDEDLSHCLRGSAKEMAPALPAGIPVPHQTEICFVDQGRRLKRLTGGQPGSQPRSQAAQLSVEHRQQFSRGLLLLGLTRWITLRHWGNNFKFLGPSSAPFSDVL